MIPYGTTNVDAPRPAILVMDLQRDFLDARDGRLPIPRDDGDRLIAVANRVSRLAAQSRLPVVFIASHFRASDRIGTWLRRRAALADTPGAAIDPRVIVPADAVEFRKATADAFTNPAFVHHLRECRVRTLLVLGVFAEGCVRATVASGLRCGYAVHVLASGVASNARWKTRWALADMKRRGAHLVDEHWLHATARPWRG